MNSILTLSPPTSRAMAARSSVLATRLTVARAEEAPARSSTLVTTAGSVDGKRSMKTSLESVGAVRADGEEELEQELVGGAPFPETGVAVLGADLAELARPIGEDEGAALVGEGGVLRAVREVVARAREPPPPELVFEIAIAAEGIGGLHEVLPPAPGELGAREEMRVDGPPERPVAERAVEAEEAGRGIGGHPIVAVGHGAAQVHVGGLRDVLIRAEMADVGQIAARGRFEDRRVAPVGPRRGLPEDPGVRE